MAHILNHFTQCSIPNTKQELAGQRLNKYLLNKQTPVHLVSVKTRDGRGEGRKAEGGRERRKQGYKAGRKPHNYNC